MYQCIHKFVLCLTLLTIISSNGVAFARAEAVTGQLSIMATLGGKPAFRSVVWKLTPKSPHNKTATILVYEHAKTLDLEPGHYQVSVSLGNKTRIYQIIIKESSKQKLIVDLMKD